MRLSASLAMLSAFFPTSNAINFTAAPAANLDLSGLGQVGIAGDFTGISLYQYEGQTEASFTTNGSEALLARLPNGVLTSIAQADASIESMCSYVTNGAPQGVIIGGNFTSLGGKESVGIALFNPNTSEVTSLQGLQGSVNAVLCDDDTVYIGGNFMGIDNSTNAVSYSAASGFEALPFAGFNGPVSSITRASNGHIIFGGSFTGLGNTSTPSEPDEQVINLSSANITATGSATTSGFSDPSNIICKTGDVDGSGSTWLLADGATGSWQANMNFGYRPTKLRLYNTHQDGRGTRTWRFTALPINGIMNFTYIDPSTNANTTCTSECTLSSNSSVTYQDFHFVNVIGMNGFRIDITGSYGDGGGLDGIELFQDDIFAYAVSGFNEPACASISTASNATSTGPWTISPSLASSSEYLTASLSSPITNDSATVVFYPDIREAGYYTVNMYTPGCLQDSSCGSRGQVQLTGTMSLTKGDNGTINTALYQTNDYDKYDPIYYGYVDATSSSFKPAVTLAPLNGQSIITQTIVAQKVGFVIYNTTSGLNGLFEYDPAVTTYNSSTFTESVFDSLGMNFTSESTVNALATNGDFVYIGGNFSTDSSSSVVSVNSQSSTVQTLAGGLNGLVTSLYVNDTSLWVGGSFDNTQAGDASGLANVAQYDTTTGSWAPLGAGVNGPISSVVPLTMNISSTMPELVISFTGNFTQIYAFDNNSALSTDGFGVWVPSRGNWIGNLGLDVEYLDGVLTTSLLNVTGSDPLYAGAVVSAQLGAVDGASLDDLSSNNLVLGEYSSAILNDVVNATSLLATTDTISNGSTSGVFAGAFLNSNGLNLTILAGRFSARASNGSTINNVAIVDGSNGSISGFTTGFAEQSAFTAAAVQGSTLFAGGNVSGTINGARVQGLVSFDLKSGDYGLQPPPLAGDNSTVNAIAVRPDSGDVYVGGSFSSAGSLGCPSVCIYSTTSSSWTRPGSNLEGVTKSMTWVSNKNLVAGGNLTVNSSEIYLASFAAGDTTWNAYSGASALPGPVDIVTMGSSDGSEIWVAGTALNGSAYVMKYDGSSWKSPGQILDSGTDVLSLQIFSLTESHASSDLLDDKMALMLTGRIIIPGFGTASAALFNGTTLTPFALTANSGNQAGTISRIFTEKTGFFTGTSSGSLPIYAVVLIGLAIALGLTLLIVVAGMAMERLRKKREGYVPAPTSTFDRGSGMHRIPPQELLESLGKGRPGAPTI
ncbi:cortical protein marker for cell polarity-domain-containing protein [Coniella lustricola]|uniref:Cortical protein marker for cell polarity-domain-containing protein n=1 Tax=Coniella lustricola TaxID=2025994 RepID=A0A2T3AAW0_9PEZI|nr:cortical protein marker for cell polarity-domain-containing protein [Coniella lustricola]